MPPKTRRRDSGTLSGMTMRQLLKQQITENHPVIKERKKKKETISKRDNVLFAPEPEVSITKVVNRVKTEKPVSIPKPKPKSKVKKELETPRYFMTIADVFYETLDELKAYQKKINSTPYLRQQEEMWAEDYLQQVMSYMGTEEVMLRLLPNAMVFFKDENDRNSKVLSERHVPVSQTRPQIHHSGKHWRARRPGEQSWFDPFDYYQLPGTNQFCQTYAVMYLLGMVERQRKNHPSTLERYYKFTVDAINFIVEVVHRTEPDKKQKELYLLLLKELKAHPFAALNVVEIPPKELR